MRSALRPAPFHRNRAPRAASPLIRVLCLLLALLMLPMLPMARASAESDGVLVEVFAREIATDARTSLLLLKTDDGYYIHPIAAASLAGLTCKERSGKYVFSNRYSTITVKKSAVDTAVYAGKTYLDFEPLMQALQTFVIATDDGSELLYNALQKNVYALLNRADALLGKDGNRDIYHADLLDGDSTAEQLFGQFTRGLSWTWNTLTGIRVHALWGGAYREDMQKLMVDLILPYEEQTSIFGTIRSVNKTLNTISRNMLKVEEAYEWVVEQITDGEIPIGSDPFLFGISETYYLREGMEAIKAVNSTPIYDLGTFLDLAAYIGGVANASDIFGAAANTALADSRVAQLKKPRLFGIAETVLNSYNAVRRQSVVDITFALGEQLAQETLNIGFKKVTETAIDTLVYNGALKITKLLVKAEKLVFDKVFGISDIMDAVLNSYRYAEFQELFLAAYDEALSGKIVTGRDAIRARSAAIMYLRCARNSWEGFVSTEDIGEMSKERVRNVERQIATLLEFSDGMFADGFENADIPVGKLAPVRTFRDGDILPSALMPAETAYAPYPDVSAVTRTIVQRAYREYLITHGAVRAYDDTVGEECTVRADVYALADLNADGLDELLIGKLSDTDPGNAKNGFAENVTIYCVLGYLDRQVTPLGVQRVDHADHPYTELIDGTVLYNRYLGSVQHAFLQFDGHGLSRTTVVRTYDRNGRIDSGFIDGKAVGGTAANDRIDAFVSLGNVKKVFWYENNRKGRDANLSAAELEDSLSGQRGTAGGGTSTPAPHTTPAPSEQGSTPESTLAPLPTPAPNLSSGAQDEASQAFRIFLRQNSNVRYNDYTIRADAFSLADLDGDGICELLVGEFVYNGADPMQAVGRGFVDWIAYYSVFRYDGNGQVAYLYGQYVDTVDYTYTKIIDGHILYNVGHGTGGTVAYTFLQYDGRDLTATRVAQEYGMHDDVVYLVGEDEVDEETMVATRKAFLAAGEAKTVFWYLNDSETRANKLVAPCSPRGPFAVIDRYAGSSTGGSILYNVPATYSFDEDEDEPKGGETAPDEPVKVNAGRDDADFYAANHLRKSADFLEDCGALYSEANIKYSSMVCAEIVKCFEQDGKRYITVNYLKRTANDGFNYDDASDKTYTLLVSDDADISIFLDPDDPEEGMERYETADDPDKIAGSLFYKKADWSRFKKLGTKPLQLRYYEGTHTTPLFYLIAFDKNDKVICLWQDIINYMC